VVEQIERAELDQVNLLPPQCVAACQALVKGLARADEIRRLLRQRQQSALLHLIRRAQDRLDA